VTSAFGGQRSIQLSYGRLSNSITEGAPAGNEERSEWITSDGALCAQGRGRPRGIAACKYLDAVQDRGPKGPSGPSVMISTALWAT
jgi:hypothetical protein